LAFTVSRQAARVNTGFLPLLAAGLLGGGVTAAVLLGTGAAGDQVSRTVVEGPPLEASASPMAASGGALSAREIYRRDAPGVVLVRARSVQAEASSFDLLERSDNVATGSGFVIDEKGHLLTCAHVVAGATDVRVSFGGGKTVAARVVGKDESTDLAMLEVDPAAVQLHPLPLGSSKGVQVGDPTVSIANPYGRTRTLTTGIVSARQERITAPSGLSIDDVLQTDAPLNPANACGPLLDSTGRVIGVNSQLAAAGPEGGAVGIGFAIPIDTAKALLPQLEAHLVVTHSYLGLRGIEGGEGLVTMAGGTVAGVLVGEVGASPVDPDGGDIVTAVAGHPVRSMADIEEVVQRHRPGDGIALRLLREGRLLTVQVELTERPASVPAG
jgi:S1-C subfamily serine protease